MNANDAAADTASRYVVLLRGINVGGHNRVPMAELRDALSEAGFVDVATYIQSGNIIVKPEAGTKQRKEGAADAEAIIVATVEEVMADTFGLTIPVVARAAGDWPTVVADNPFPEHADQPKLLHVYFCGQEPSPDALDYFDADKYPSDEIRLMGRHLYIFYGGGASRSKLTTNELEKRLGVTTTGRNWSTVTKLAELLTRP